MMRAKIWSATAVVMFIMFVPIVAQAMTFDRIIVFGGSLSDSGNAFALYGFANRPPYDQLDPLLVPSGPYSVGGNHFSNGATWIEQLARRLGLSGSVRPAFASKFLGGTDYAVGGARARENGVDVNMPEQVTEFLKEFDNVAPSDALYVIDFGGNDIRDALLELPDSVKVGAVIEAALGSLSTNMQLLYNLGARKFLILTVADIGKLPSVLILDKSAPGIAGFATQLTETFNAQFNSIVDTLAGLLPGFEVAKFDVFGKVDAVIADVIANGEALGFTNATEACIEPNDPPFKCKKPDEYVFWDGIHPTKAGHAFLAERAAEVLAP